MATDAAQVPIKYDGTAQYSATALAAFYNRSTDIRAQIIKFYNETREFEAKVGIIIPSIFTVVIFVGLVGNLLVIVVALNRQMRNSTNTLIIGLTCSDLMFLTLCVPFTAIDYAFPVWVLPTWSCNAINYLQHSSAYFSVWTLTLMAADRFLAVCYPVESMTLRSSKNTCIALFITYGIIMLSQIQVARIHDVYDYTFVIEQRSACSIVSIAKAEATVVEARLYFFSFNVFGYVFPLAITCIFYYFMLRRLWNMPKPGNHNNSSCESRGSGAGSMKTNISKLSSPSSSLRCRPETIRAKRKVTRLVMCVVVIWALCWLPLNICFFISGLIYPDTLVTIGGKPVIILQISSQVLAYTNSCLNPILYPLVSDNFRKGFLRVIGTILNWCTFGRLCKRNRTYRFNSRLEVTFYNNDGSRSRSSTNNNRMSRTNSCASHRHNTSSTVTTNTHVFGELSSLLVRSSYSSRAGSGTTASMLVTDMTSIADTKRASAGHPKFMQRNSRTEISSVSLPLLLPSASVDSDAPITERSATLVSFPDLEARSAMRRSITLTRKRQNRDTIDENEADEREELSESSNETNRKPTNENDINNASE